MSKIGNFPSVLASDGNYYPIDKMLDKEIIAAKDVAIIRNPYDNPIKTVFVAKKGASLGILWSWIANKGEIWLMFKDQNGKSYYANARESVQGSILQSQNVPTTKENSDKQDGTPDKKWYEVLSENIGEGMKWGAIAVGGYIIYDMATKKNKVSGISGLKPCCLVKLGLIGVGAYLLLNNSNDAPKPKNNKMLQPKAPTSKNVVAPAEPVEFVPLAGFYNDDFSF